MFPRQTMMRLSPACLIIVAPLVMAPAGIARVVPEAKSLCTINETAIFECSTGAKSVAVCAGATDVHYRSGTPGKIELASPAGSAGLSYASRVYPYSGIEESQVRFTSGSHAYVVYNDVHHANFGANEPEVVSGVIVTKGSKHVSNRKCVLPAGAELDLDLAQKRLPEGEFEDHD